MVLVTPHWQFLTSKLTCNRPRSTSDNHARAFVGCDLYTGRRGDRKSDRCAPNGTSLRYIILTSMKGMPATCCLYRSDPCDMSCRYEQCFDHDTFPTHQPTLTRFIKGKVLLPRAETRREACRDRAMLWSRGWHGGGRKNGDTSTSFDQTTSIDSHSKSETTQRTTSHHLQTLLSTTVETYRDSPAHPGEHLHPTTSGGRLSGSIVDVAIVVPATHLSNAPFSRATVRKSN